MKFTKISQINFQIYRTRMQPSKKNFEISYKFPFVPKTATSLLYSVSCRKEPYFLQVGHPFRAKRKLTLLPILYFRSCLVIQKAYKYSLFRQKRCRNLSFLAIFWQGIFVDILLFRIQNAVAGAPDIRPGSALVSFVLYFKSSKHPLPCFPNRKQGKGCLFVILLQSVQRIVLTGWEGRPFWPRQ